MQSHEGRFSYRNLPGIVRRLLRGFRHACIAIALAGMVPLSAIAEDEHIQVDPDGTVHLPPRIIPLSNYLSPEARDFMIKRLSRKLPSEPDIAKLRAWVEKELQPWVDLAKERYPSEIVRTKIAGVPVYDITPHAGIKPRNSNRILIHLHGGAFAVCEIGCALSEAIPAAGIGGFHVVSVTYRQGPEHKFPAASEDVAAVYRELLKRYRPENIGIFGCSAGGMLTAASLAWFQKHNLPRPGAAGLLCSGAADFGGDAPFVQWPIDDLTLTPPPTEGDRKGNRVELPPFEYFSGTNARDPLVQPGHFPEVLRQFPPTIIATGGRGFDASAAYDTHRRLWRVGVKTELHVWDGLPHGFHNNVSMPESRELFDVVMRFFDSNLGRRPR
ncbi:MAG TPA: alpha/beta hydrolase fold domain-containing protein [Burkholderiaceae bacterium]|nr:alpha/beta hydrolase fold domain-containing protein [Burkholderiaceae bacterium]